MALRLYEFETKILDELNVFLASEEFNRAIAEKFNLVYEDCQVDGGIQKYLDGYEISPHVDIRRKAATFMVNINPSADSEAMDHHTHYMNFKPAYSYLKEFWAHNPSIETCWMPWEWAETMFQQSRNNSVVLFSPSNATLHAVRASYDHLLSQRTQLYGNLWFKTDPAKRKIDWEEIDLLGKTTVKKKSGIAPVLGSLRASARNGLRRLAGKVPVGVRRI